MSITINESATFLIASDTGDIPEGGANGLFSEDTRFLSRYLLQLDGRPLIVLAAEQVDYRTAEHFLTNPELRGAPASSLGIVRRRTITLGLRDELTIRNYGDRALDCTLELLIDADFADIFQVKLASQVDKNAIRQKGDFDSTVEGEGRRLRLTFQRADLYRELDVRLSLPLAVEPGRCRAEIHLAPRESWDLTVDFTTSVASRKGGRPRADGEVTDDAIAASAPAAPPPPPTDTGPRHATLVARAPTLRTGSYVLRRAYERTVHDYAALRLQGEAICEGNLVVAAGIPWFMALFGRDSLIASYQALPFAPDLAAGTLRALAALQGNEFDQARAEQPGKILHEHRFGTITGAQRSIPRFPYYGSVDSTPLFLMVLAAHHHLTGDLELARELHPNALRALEWIERYGDLDGDGYLEYQDKSNGLANQGWKDSGDSIRFRDGRLAEGPIALCEVQGYAYAARLGLANLCAALGDTDRAKRLRDAARDLKDRFNHDFWLPDRDSFALALDGEKRPVDSLTSNPGHLLWTGIADEEKARATARTLLSPELFSGWGIRTMATTDGGYNPVSYHNGSIWPHDNSLILTGLARYGLTEEATRVVDGLIAALGHSSDHRLPELFAGYGRNQAHAPVQYPTACRPQAWASGSIFLALAAATGIDLDGGTTETDPFPHPPFLPNGVNTIHLAGLHLGGDRIDVTLERGAGRIRRGVEPYHGRQDEGEGDIGPTEDRTAA